MKPRPICTTTPNGEVKRLGEHPIVLEFASDNASIEVATRPEQRPLAVAKSLTNTTTPAPPETATS